MSLGPTQLSDQVYLYMYGSFTLFSKLFNQIWRVQLLYWQDILVNGDITNTINVPENSKSLLVAELKTVDEDLQDKQSYFLSGPASNQFKIQGNMLFVRNFA